MAEREVRVLLVDDQRLVVQAVRRLLAPLAGVSYLGITEPLEARAVALEFRPTVLLLDLVMPGIGGLELISELRAESELADVPVVVMSSKDGGDMKAESFAAGANDYLVKLPHPLELEARLRYHSRALHLHRERRRNTAELRRLNKDLAAATAAKADFFARMSHELRTPLHGILGMLDVLLGTPVDEQQREYLQVARTSAGSLRTIVDDILDFSKGEAGKLELEGVPLDLARMVDELGQLWTGPTEERGLTLTTSLDPGLHTQRLGDPTRLRQVLDNLLSNAIKFTSEGGVSVTASGRGDVVRFEVADSGIGLDPAAQAQLFRAFSQAEASTTRRFGGTGLGLAIVKQLVELMGGELGVESAPAEGSTFWFEVPLPEHVAEGPPRSPDGIAGAEPPLNLRVLVVDDDATNLLLARTHLEGMGCTVRQATDGEQGVRAALDEDFDAVLMDWHLPRLDGFQATAAIRGAGSARSSVPIIAVTARVMPGDAARCLDAGMNGYLAKPFGARELRAELARSVGGLQLRSPARPPAVSDRALLDPAAIAAVEELGGPPLAIQILELFLRDLPARRERIARLGSAGDPDEARLAAHALKSSALNVGALALSDHCGRLEEALLDGRLELALSVVSELEATARSTETELVRARRQLGG